MIATFSSLPMVKAKLGLSNFLPFVVSSDGQTCLAAQECGSLDFDVTGNAWFSEDDNIFACPGERGEGMGSWDDGETSPVTYLGTLLKVCYTLI